jgi:hypothetical protein
VGSVKSNPVEQVKREEGLDGMLMLVGDDSKRDAHTHR